MRKKRAKRRNPSKSLPYAVRSVKVFGLPAALRKRVYGRPAKVHRIAGVTIPRTHRGAGFRPFAKAFRPKKNPRRSPLKKLKDRLHAALVLGYDPRFKRRVTEGFARRDRGRKGRVIYDGWIKSQRERARIKAAARRLFQMRAKNPLTKRQMRDMSSWKAQARLQAAAMSDWEFNERAPAFLKYRVPSMRSRSRQSAAALRQWREVNPLTHAEARRLRDLAAGALEDARYRGRGLGRARAYAGGLMDAIVTAGGKKDADRAHRSFRRLISPKTARRRNPWPALANGFAAGLGLFAANQVTTAIRSNGKRKRRKKR